MSDTGEETGRPLSCFIWSRFALGVVNGKDPCHANGHIVLRGTREGEVVADFEAYGALLSIVIVGAGADIQGAGLSEDVAVTADHKGYGVGVATDKKIHAKVVADKGRGGVAVRERSDSAKFEELQEARIAGIPSEGLAACGSSEMCAGRPESSVGTDAAAGEDGTDVSVVIEEGWSLGSCLLREDRGCENEEHEQEGCASGDQVCHARSLNAVALSGNGRCLTRELLLPRRVSLSSRYR